MIATNSEQILKSLTKEEIIEKLLNVENYTDDKIKELMDQNNYLKQELHNSKKENERMRLEIKLVDRDELLILEGDKSDFHDIEYVERQLNQFHIRDIITFGKIGVRRELIEWYAFTECEKVKNNTEIKINNICNNCEVDMKEVAKEISEQMKKVKLQVF